MIIQQVTPLQVSAKALPLMEAYGRITKIICSPQLMQEKEAVTEIS